MRAVVIGSGFGRQHLEWLTQCDCISVSALVYQRDAERAHALAEEFGIERTTTDLDAVIRTGDVDLVAISSPPDTHEKFAQCALDAGLLTVVDKPLCHSLPAALHLEGHSRSSAAAVVFQWRTHPGFQQLRYFLSSKRLGQLLRMDLEFHHDFLAGVDPALSWRHEPTRAGAGALGDQGVHLFDALHELAPLQWQVSAAHGVATSRQRERADGTLFAGTEDIAETWLVDSSGLCHARVFVSRVSSGFHALRILAHGDRATAELHADPVTGSARVTVHGLSDPPHEIEFPEQEMNPYPAIIESHRDPRKRSFDEVASIGDGVRAQRLMCDAVARIDGEW